jgi:hypothetical protein
MPVSRGGAKTYGWVLYTIKIGCETSISNSIKGCYHLLYLCQHKRTQEYMSKACQTLVWSIGEVALVDVVW